MSAGEVEKYRNRSSNKDYIIEGIGPSEALLRQGGI